MSILCRLLGHDIKYKDLDLILSHIRKNENLEDRNLTVCCKRCGQDFDFNNEVLR